MRSLPRRHPVGTLEIVPQPLDADRARALVGSLLDDAATFPPGNAAMAEAVPAHRAHADSWYADLVGPFVCATSRVPQLLDALASPGSPGEAGEPGAPSGVRSRVLDPLRVVLVADNGTLGVAQARNLLLDDDRVELVGLEIALPREGDPATFARHVLDALAFAVPAAIEVPYVPGWEAALDVLAADGAERAKFRTGGPVAAAIPAPEQLAGQVLAAVERRVPFKLTAGLHHALRGAEQTDGVPHHGFLIVLAATAAAVGGAGLDEVTGTLAATEADVLLGPLRDCDPASVRRAFTSIGTCSITDPVADLVGLGLLVEEAA
jgi:hypothetical protein